MYHVLVFGMTSNPGGMESFLMNYCSHMDKERFHFDYLCNTYETIAYENELIAMGAEVYHIPARSERFFRYRKELKAFFEKNGKRYNAIWVNACSLANIDYLILAKKYGIPKRIIHSHSSQSMGKSMRELLHKYYRTRIGKYATDFWACSSGAAAYFFPPCRIQNVKIVPNAIDARSFQYDGAKRQYYRKMLHWEDKFIVGNVGRLHFEKNQLFLLEIFCSIKAIQDHACLLLIGQGEDELKLKRRVRELGLEAAVCFAGVQQDIQGWLSAMDFFLFPSRFEGFGIALLEAQANGLPVLASDRVIPGEVKINENVKFCDLRCSANEWAEQVLRMTGQGGRLESKNVLEHFARSKYEIRHAARRLEMFFEGTIV